MMSKSSLASAVAACVVGAAAAYYLDWCEPQRRRRKILVVGSINVDLYQQMQAASVKIAGKPIDISAVKGMTLPAASFVKNPKIAAQGLAAADGKEEELVLAMDGPFEQKTGGKGANSAAAAGQTFACEFFGNLGMTSAEENRALLSDLATYGRVDTSRCALLPNTPTGTAYILLFDDADNAIILLGGANQAWPAPADIARSEALKAAVSGCAVLMLQREVPEYVNVAAAKLARSMGKPVFMDVGGTDAPLDTDLMPYISVISPNESELTFLTGVPTEDAHGHVSKPQVRSAVAALKQKFDAAGNTAVEVLVTLGGTGSIHFGAAWPRLAPLTKNNRRAFADDFSAIGALPYETHMGTFRLASPDGAPVDTTGAGDCYRGSYVGARYGEGRELMDAMQWAAAAGSLSVEVRGAMPSMPPRAKIAQRVAEPLVGVRSSRAAIAER